MTKASIRSLSTAMEPALNNPGTKAGKARVTPPSVTSTVVSRIMVRAIAMTIMRVILVLKGRKQNRSRNSPKAPTRITDSNNETHEFRPSATESP